jgi:hypothetical protein
MYPLSRRFVNCSFLKVCKHQLDLNICPQVSSGKPANYAIDNLFLSFDGQIATHIKACLGEINGLWFTFFVINGTNIPVVIWMQLVIQDKFWGFVVRILIRKKHDKHISCVSAMLETLC